jgi:hypothetical protein
MLDYIIELYYVENMKDETVSKAIMTMVEYGSTIRSDAHKTIETHLQKYLNEFCYRLNRRFCEQVFFDKLVNACIIFQPIVCAESTL